MLKLGNIKAYCDLADVSKLGSVAVKFRRGYHFGTSPC